MNVWLLSLASGGLSGILLGLCHACFRAGFHAGQDDQRWTETARRLERLERREGYYTPPSE